MQDYRLIRSKRRTISVEIEHDGTVTVRAPRLMPARMIRSFVDSKSDWIRTRSEKQRLNKQQHRPVSPAEAAQLKQNAQRILPERVRYFSSVMEIPVPQIKITSARTRYGSCSVANTVCFSKFLMVNSPEAIDYVVVHELAHIRHKNHGKEFWAEVASVLPDWKLRRKLLFMPDLQENNPT